MSILSSLLLSLSLPFLVACDSVCACCLFAKLGSELKVAVTQGGRGASAVKGQTWSSASEAPRPWWDGVIADLEDGNGDDDNDYDYGR